MHGHDGAYPDRVRDPETPGPWYFPPVATVISEYVDVAHAFYDKRESGFVNGLLDAIAKEARAARSE